MKVQMFQMYCGESILVSNDESCLLIDCGSHSSDISLFDNVINTLCHFRHKEAMITHFHDDHFNGFMYITDPVRTRVVSFDNVYIPHIFTVGLHYNVIDYMLMYYYLDSKKYLRKNNFSLLELLKRMVKSRIPFTLLKRGDNFTSYGNINEVLWPVPKELVIHSSGVMLPKFVINKIFDISDKICKLFLHCYDLQGNYGQNIDNDIEEIYKLIETIDEGILYSSDDEYIALDDGKYILKKDYENYYEREDINNFYRNLVTDMKGKDNQTSIVFQSVKSHYLFTGDITKRIMNKIVKDTYSPSMKLNSDYEAVKAPHHGTKSHYIKLLFENPSSIKIKKVFISNGTCGKTGPIHTLYSQNTYFDLICSNCDPQKCNSSYCIHRNCPLMCTAMAKSFLIDI